MKLSKKQKIFILVGVICLFIIIPAISALIVNKIEAKYGYSVSKKSGTYSVEDLSVTEEATIGTNLTTSNGYLKSAVTDTVSTTYETVNNILYAHCTGSDINGCDDGVYNVIRFMVDSQDIDGSAEATTSAEIRVYADDTASSSMEFSIELWGRLDNQYALTKIQDWDSGTSGLTGAATIGSTFSVTGESQLSRTITGGSVLASTSLAGDILTAANICDNSIMSWTIPKSAINVTLPASSSLIADCLDTVGDSVTVIFRNLSTTAASSTTIVASSEIDLISDDSNGDVIAGKDTAKISFHRGSVGTDLVVIIDPYTPAD